MSFCESFIENVRVFNMEKVSQHSTKISSIFEQIKVSTSDLWIIFPWVRSGLFWKVSVDENYWHCSGTPTFRAQGTLSQFRNRARDLVGNVPPWFIKLIARRNKSCFITHENSEELRIQDLPFRGRSDIKRYRYDKNSIQVGYNFCALFFNNPGYSL